MGKKERKMLWALLAGIAILSMALFGCGGGDMDRSGWGWDGSKGNPPDSMDRISQPAAATATPAPLIEPEAPAE